MKNNINKCISLINEIMELAKIGEQETFIVSKLKGYNYAYFSSFIDTVLIQISETSLNDKIKLDICYTDTDNKDLIIKDVTIDYYPENNKLDLRGKNIKEVLKKLHKILFFLNIDVEQYINKEFELLENDLYVPF